MPVLVPSETRCRTRRVRDFGGLYTALVLLSFHWALVIYINSSFLEQFFSERIISFLYTGSALLTIVAFLVLPRMLTALGNRKFLRYATYFEFITLIFLPFVDTPVIVGLLFIVHQAIIPLLLFSLDIFMESLTGDCEKETGGRRGLFLTIASLTIALSALLSGYLIGDSTPQYDLVYATSALLLIPFLIIVHRSFREWKDDTYELTRLSSGIARVIGDSDVRSVFGAHFILQLFFSWMVIYTPLYMSSVLGIPWTDIGRILFVGLMAYVLLEYVIGVIADSKLGEKEMMALGFLILTVSTSWFAFLHDASVLLWMIAMFMTRVGASLVEVTTESYFFKHTNGSDSALISFFRITRPLATVLGALLGTITLFFIDGMEMLFIILSLLMIPGFFFAMGLRDTR